MSSPFPLDAQSLVLLQTTISFITAPFNAPSYNFPLFLFGIYATDNTNSNEPLRLFSVLVGASGVLDIIWLIKTTDQSGFIAMLSFINLLLKAPTFFAILVALRHRGAGFSAGQLGGAASTVWSMPGAFAANFSGGQSGYQNLDGDDIESARPPPASHSAPGYAPPSAPPPAPPKSTPYPANAPGSYQV